MDPNKTLADLLTWAKHEISYSDVESAEIAVGAQLFLDLDKWLTKGGFLPDRWKSPVDAKAYNWAKDHEINHQLAEASRAQVRQALHEINQSLHEAEAALHDARTILNIELPRP